MKKVMLVTGGGRGIGAAIARLAAQEGYAVCLSYFHSEASAKELVATITSTGGEAFAVRANVAVEEDVIRLFKEVDSTLGCVTALVNNAGILEKQSRVEDMDFNRISRVFSTNVIGSLSALVKQSAGCRQSMVELAERSSTYRLALPNLDRRTSTSTMLLQKERSIPSRWDWQKKWLLKAYA